jgi:hypothetical protein
VLHVNLYLWRTAFCWLLILRYQRQNSLRWLHACLPAFEFILEQCKQNLYSFFSFGNIICLFSIVGFFPEKYFLEENAIILCFYFLFNEILWQTFYFYTTRFNIFINIFIFIFINFLVLSFAQISNLLFYLFIISKSVKHQMISLPSKLKINRTLISRLTDWTHAFKSPVVRIWNQGVCYLCGLRFKPWDC